MHFHIYSGNDDQTIPMISMGAQGVISVFSNLSPQIMGDLCQKALSGDFEAAMALQNRYLPLMNAMFCDVNPMPVKEAMNQVGMDVGTCRMPLGDISSANQQYIRSLLIEAGLL